MRVIYADADLGDAERFMDFAGSTPYISRAVCLSSAGDVLKCGELEQTDAVFLETSFPDMDGLELARRLSELNGNLKLAFVTSDETRALEAFRAGAEGYLTKPYSDEEAEEALRRVWRVRYIPRTRVRVQTFGNFEVFADGLPVRFGRAKARELFAYLIDRRGAGATTREIAAVLFEEKQFVPSLGAQVRVIKRDMLRSLRAVGARDVIVNVSGLLAVNTKAVDCDYYRLLERGERAGDVFAGEYMTNYSWAETTAGFITSREHSVK